jgi:hypothetical protein
LIEMRRALAVPLVGLGVTIALALPNVAHAGRGLHGHGGVGGFVGPRAPRSFGHHHHFFPRPFFFSAPFFPLVVVPPPAVVYAEPPVIYQPYQYPSSQPTMGYPSVAAAVPPPAPPPPPAIPSVIEYPHGWYELRGDGVSAPYVWVWIPKPPPPPPASPAPPTLAPPEATPGRSSARKVFHWTDAAGVTHWTDRQDMVPPRDRADARRVEDL